MKYWINQIYIGLMTGILGGIVSGYIIYSYFKNSFIETLLGGIILVAAVILLSVGLYMFLFEKKGKTK